MILNGGLALTLEAGSSKQLYVHFDLLEGLVGFASSDESVARVSATGLVEWVGPGRAVITASIGQYKDIREVECEKATPSLEWEYPGTDYLAKGQTIPMRALSDSSAPIVYSVDEESQATIDGAGNLTGLGSFLFVTVTATLMVDDPISIGKTINLIGDYVSYVDILLEDLSVITIGEKITVPYRAYNVDNFDIRGESGGFLSCAGFVLEAKEVGRFNIAVSGYDIDYAESIRVNIEEPSYEVEIMMAALAVYDRDNRAVRYLQYRSWPTASNYLDSTSGYIDADSVYLYTHNGEYYLENANVNAGYLGFNDAGELDYVDDPYPLGYDLSTGAITLKDESGDSYFLGSKKGSSLFGAYPIDELSDPSILMAFLIDQPLVA